MRPLSRTPPCCSQATVQVNCRMDGVLAQDRPAAARDAFALVKKRAAVAVAWKLAMMHRRLWKSGEAHNPRLWPRLSHQVKSMQQHRMDRFLHDRMS